MSAPSRKRNRVLEAQSMLCKDAIKACDRRLADLRREAMRPLWIVNHAGPWRVIYVRDNYQLIRARHWSENDRYMSMVCYCSRHGDLVVGVCTEG